MTTRRLSAVAIAAIGAAHLAVAKGGGEIADGTDRALKFGGRASFTIPSGAVAVSDPVDLEVGVPMLFQK
jgi:hypothetical protein